MVYLDTSFIAPLVIPENNSDSVEAIVMKVKAGELATSMWARLELASVVARKLRMGEFSDSEASAVRMQFTHILDEYFHTLLPTAADYALAAKYIEIPKTGLRAADSLHLAIAANHHAKKIFTLDKLFLTVGKQLKLPIHSSAGTR